MGGFAPLGYTPRDRTLAIDGEQAERVRDIFRLYRKLGSVYRLQVELDRRGWRTPERLGRRPRGGRPFSRGHLYRILSNAIYIGQIVDKGVAHAGQHQAIVDTELWQAVQQVLANNLRGHRTRSDAAEPSLLAGLVFDEQGRWLQPTHATRRVPGDIGTTFVRRHVKRMAAKALH